MDRLIRTCLLSVVIAISIPTQTHAQTMGDSALASVNNQLRHVFSQVNYPDTAVNHFYDMSGHIIDSTWWRHYNMDTMEVNVWTTLYEELWWTQLDSTKLDSVDNFLDDVNENMPDTIEVGILRFDYYTLIDTTVFDDSTYYLWDTINGSFIDRTARTSDPHIKKRVFAFTTFRESAHVGSVVWKMDPSKILYDQNNNLNAKTGSGDSLYINFGDGNGYQLITCDTVQYYPTTYDTANNETEIAARVVSNSDSIDHSHTVFRIWGDTNAASSSVPHQTINLPGMDVGIWGACDTTGGSALSDKYIIYVEGFDFTHALTLSSNYEYVFKNTHLAELRNHGYNIAIINWRKPGEGIETNALRLAGYLSSLKCDLSDNDLDTLHQFVVIGESMGGVIARYALSYMEKNFSIDPCRSELMHNTRLFISLDAPQDGAYVPIAFQELANHRKLLSMLPAMRRGRLEDYYDMMNSTSAKQLLKIHQTSHIGPLTNNTNSVYAPTSERNAMEAALLALKPLNDGYPEHCKLFAISRGLLTGEHQVLVNNETEAMPGDFYADSEGALDVVIFGRTYNLQNFELFLGSPDGTTDDFYRFDRGLRMLRLVIPRNTITIGICPICVRRTFPTGLPRFELDYVSGKHVNRYCPACPQWDVMPGGYYASASYTNQALSGSPLIDPLKIMFADSTSADTSAFYYDGLSRIDGLELENLGQFGDFNFIPIQSALDYEIPMQPDPLDDNIYNEFVNVMMSRTPFDVIVGEINGLVNYPQAQTNLQLPRNSSFRFPAYNINHLSSFRNHRRNDSLINSDTSLYANPLFAFYLNREIGEEELMLENFDLNRTALFEAEYIIQAGTRLNPYYSYPGQTPTEIFTPYFGDFFNPNPWGYAIPDNGIFSKEATFNVSTPGSSPTATAILKADSIIDENVNAGMTGAFVEIFAPQLVCVLDYYCFGDSTGDCDTANKKADFNPNHTPDKSSISIWPNPISKEEILIVSTQGHYYSQFTITRIDGAVLMQQDLNAAYAELRINIAKLEVQQGIYLITLKDGISGQSSMLKFIVI